MLRFHTLLGLALTTACSDTSTPRTICDDAGICVDLSNTTVYPGPCTLGELTRLAYDDRGRFIGVEAGDPATGATTEIAYADDGTASRIHYSGWDGFPGIEVLGGTWTFDAGGSARERTSDPDWLETRTWRATYADDLRYTSLDLVYAIADSLYHGHPDPSGEDRVLTEEEDRWDATTLRWSYRYSEQPWDGGLERVQEKLSGDDLVDRRRYRYDADGHLVEAAPVAPFRGATASYVWDGDRLVREEGAYRAHDYVYDDAGNRRAYVAGGMTTLYDYGCWE